MSNTYRLVNPYIKGDFKSKVTAKNSVEAGKKLYKNLSEHFNNNIPKFYFTVYKGSKQGGKYYHFEVTEKKVNDEVNFSLRPYEVKNSSEQVTNFKKNLKNFRGRYAEEQEGGGKRRKSKSRKSKSRRSRRSNDSSSESDDFYRQAKSFVPVINQPITYMYYDPLVYRLDAVHIPTFYAYVTPYIEINLLP